MDSVFSLEPDEMKHFVQECQNAWKAIGDISYKITANEKNSLQFR